MCFLLENTEKSLSQKEWEEKLLLVRVLVLGRQRGVVGGQAAASSRAPLGWARQGFVCRTAARAGSAEAGIHLRPP